MPSGPPYPDWNDLWPKSPWVPCQLPTAGGTQQPCCSGGGSFGGGGGFTSGLGGLVGGLGGVGGWLMSKGGGWMGNRFAGKMGKGGGSPGGQGCQPCASGAAAGVSDLVFGFRRDREDTDSHVLLCGRANRSDRWCLSLVR